MIYNGLRLKRPLSILCDFVSKKIVIPNPLLVSRLSENVAIVARYELATEEVDGNKVLVY